MSPIFRSTKPRANADIQDPYIYGLNPEALMYGPELYGDPLCSFSPELCIYVQACFHVLLPALL